MENKLKIGNHLFATLIPLFGLYFDLAFGSSLLKEKEYKQIITAYTKLAIEERIFNEPQQQKVGGGALVALKDYLVLGKADKTFSRINIRNWEYEDDFLPPIETGENLNKSIRYKHRELSPRIEGLLYSNGIFYVSYTRYDVEKDLIHFVIAKIRKSEKKWTTIYDSPGLNAPYFTLGLGGKLAITGNRLYFTCGDFSLDRINGLSSDVASQNINLPWGKINYIDLDSGKFHVYTSGHRNPLGLVILQNGLMLATENGPQGGDEINIISEGKNYGWPYKSFGTHYGSFDEYGDALPASKKMAGQLEDPIYVFVPSPALSDIIQISNFHKKWDDNLLLGSLKAKSLFHVKLDKKRIIFVEQIPINYRIRSLVQNNNSFFIYTDEGSILKVNAIPEDFEIKKNLKKYLNKIR
jgi:hypothetical protein